MTDSYRIRFSKNSEDDLTDIVRYIQDELKEPQAARQLYTKIKTAILSLADQPKRIAVVRDERLAHQGYRLMRVENYHVFFVIDDDAQSVLIVRILYSRRNWPVLL